MERVLTEQELIRREKAEKIRAMGLDPFGHRFDKSDFAADLKSKYGSLEHDDFEKEEILATVAGRIMFIRRMGKASFFTIQDKTGNIQIYISVNDVGLETYDLFKSADIGDIVGVYGRVMKTKTGEITLKCI